MPVLRGKKRDLALELESVRREIQEKVKSLLQREVELTEALKEELGAEASGKYTAGNLVFNVSDSKKNNLCTKLLEKEFGEGASERLAKCYKVKSYKRISITEAKKAS